MIELDGREYTVKSGAEYTQDMVTWINDYCSANDIRNSKGETIQISAVLTNPLYILLRGLGQLVAIICQLIYSIACGFSIPQASDKQLLNLCDIAGIKRGSKTYTTIDLLIYASLTDACNVYTTDTVTIDGVEYKPAFDLEIAAGGVGHVVLIATEYGAYNVAEDSITDFDTPLVNLRNIKQYASIPGAEEEPLSKLRERLQRRTVSGSQVDKASDAIRELPGITMCNIFFNTSATQERVINSITIKPRAALLLIQGFSLDIAKAFFSNCICDTTPATTQRTITQNYITHANQSLPCYIVSPSLITCYVVVYIKQTVTDEIIQQMKDSIMTISKNLTAGEPVTSQMILSSLESYAVYELAGATAGLTSALQSYQATPQVDELLVFTSDSIVIEVVA